MPVSASGAQRAGAGGDLGGLRTLVLEEPQFALSVWEDPTPWWERFLPNMGQ